MIRKVPSPRNSSNVNIRSEEIVEPEPKDLDLNYDNSLELPLQKEGDGIEFKDCPTYQEIIDRLLEKERDRHQGKK